MPASRSRASSFENAIGSSEMLPLVITSGTPTSASKQMVQRRVGQHHAQIAGMRGDGRGDPHAGPARSDDDRPLAAEDLRRRLDQRRGVANHQGERPVLAVLARPQPRHGRLVVGAAGEMEAADPFDGDDRAREQRLHRLLDPRRHPRAARRARVRLRVKAPVARVVVLGLAEVAHRRNRPSS